MERYLEGNVPDEATIKKLISREEIVLSASFVPVECGSALKNKVVQPFLDAVVDYDLSAMKDDPENPELIIESEASDDAPFDGLAFKIMGFLTFVRVYSGKLIAGSYILNLNKGKKQRIGRLLKMHANIREDVKVVVTGDIIALAGLKVIITSEILCDLEKTVVLERMDSLILS